MKDREKVRMIKIEIDKERCSGCGICADFCPTSVLDLVEVKGRTIARATHAENCWACNTCVGQCPQEAIHVIEKAPERIAISPDMDSDRHGALFTPLNADECASYAAMSASLERVLGLRWKPVAVTLIPQNATSPPVPVPHVKLRYCQSLMAARRGKTLLMPPQAHACPDGTHILGLTEIPPKLASGELYIKFGKLASIEAARQMITERPHLPERSIRATLATPLGKAVMRPDVVVIMAPPESVMWVCMASSFYTGKRFTFKVTGYNALCAEVTAYPFITGEMNISLGCYGCRGSSDISDNEMFIGVPIDKLPSLVDGLEELSKKAIPDVRSKIYLPPLI